MYVAAQRQHEKPGTGGRATCSPQALVGAVFRRLDQKSESDTSADTLVGLYPARVRYWGMLVGYHGVHVRQTK